MGLGELATGLFLVWLFVINPIWLVWTWIPCRVKYPLVYAPIYHVGVDQVHALQQPTDCDWWHAPLGDKGCRYKKQVLTKRNEAGRVTDILVTWEKLQN